MSEEIKHFYEFGPFRLDPRKRRLMRDGEPVRLTPKALDLLLVLVEERGRTVEKDELLEKVWAGTVVEENNLNQNITALRKSLGDSRQESQYIATVPGLGYRFVADVSVVEEEVLPPDAKAQRKKLKRLRWKASLEKPGFFGMHCWFLLRWFWSLLCMRGTRKKSRVRPSYRSWFCRWRTCPPTRNRNTLPMA